STTVVFIVMAIVLLVRPAGLFGSTTRAAAAGESHASAAGFNLSPPMVRVIAVVLVAGGLVAPLVVYPVFLMKVLCFALFACAFNLLLGYVGLLSFGHAAFYGGAS